MKYRKLDKAMQKADVEYSMEGTDVVFRIETGPENNDIALKTIESALGGDEICVNSSRGTFRVIQRDIKVRKTG